MGNRNRGRRLQIAMPYRGESTRPVRRVSCQPSLDVLENRQLLTASLQAIPAVTVPALQGYTVPLLANSGTAQNFTVTSSNRDVSASVAQGPFWTLGVSYTDSTAPSQSFTGSLTFQLFQTLTPNTVKMITQFTNDGFYVNSGYYFPRIVSNFDSPTTTVIQGGSTSSDGAGSGGQPNTPFANENVQQLALTGVDQLALANAGGTDTNNTQFFINTGPADALGYNYTVFGQLVSGQSTLARMAQIPVQANPVTGELSQPVNPLKITSASLSSTNPDGVVILDTTQAKPGETATITVRATDPADGTTTSQSFNVLVGPYIGPATSSTVGSVNFKPYANPVAAAAFDNVATQVQLSGLSTYPDTSVSAPVTYDLISQPSHGTVSNFDGVTGTLTYTPDPGYLGTDSFQYLATATGPNTSAAPAISNPATVTLAVSTAPPVVSVQNVALATNKKHMVSQIDVTFSGQVNATEAGGTQIYDLAYPNKKGSYTARNAVGVKLRSAVYNTATDTVTLTPRKPFALKAQALQLVIDGTSPSGLQDMVGRYLAGANNGQAGTDAVVSISKNGVIVQ
ncbi:MAG TPA: peptidylprolyl isomerase [Isosphaeraceae bacterium]|nr:peptidylprolyl isomerase [Isosphaeraceae bacterium]